MLVQEASHIQELAGYSLIPLGLSCRHPPVCWVGDDSSGSVHSACFFWASPVGRRTHIASLWY